jgi:hypothetical protein
VRSAGGVWVNLWTGGVAITRRARNHVIGPLKDSPAAREFSIPSNKLDKTSDGAASFQNHPFIMLVRFLLSRMCCFFGQPNHKRGENGVVR